MIRDSTPGDLTIPSPDEIAAEFEQPIAVVRGLPQGWWVMFGQQRSDDFLCHVDVGYRLGRQLVAVVQTSRPVPDSFRVRSESTLSGQLNTFLANSGRPDRVATTGNVPGPDRTAVTLNGRTTATESLSFAGCTSARIAVGAISVIVTAPDELWQTASDLSYFRADDH